MIIIVCLQEPVNPNRRWIKGKHSTHVCLVQYFLKTVMEGIRWRRWSQSALSGQQVGERTALTDSKTRNSKEVLAVSELIQYLRLPPRAPWKRNPMLWHRVSFSMISVPFGQRMIYASRMKERIWYHACNASISCDVSRISYCVSNISLIRPEK